MDGTAREKGAATFFQGRYKAVPVSGSDADAHYFKALADYIHLNPARAIRHLGLPSSMSGLSGLKKSDARKAQLAILLRTHTSMSNDWIAVKLAMGHPGSVSRVVSAGRSDKSMMSTLHEIVLIREQ